MKLKFFLAAMAACFCAISASAQKSVAAWVNFNGGEDVRNIAVDSRNIYVTLAWANRMIAIDKASGEIKAVKADGVITWAVVARDVCYYNVAGQGLFTYNSATGASEGPMAAIEPSGNEELVFAASPDGRYIFCNDAVLDLTDGSVTPTEAEEHPYAVNNEGGVFSANPESWYTPLDGPEMQLSRIGSSCQSYYVDTDKCYYCFDQGMGVSGAVPDGNITPANPSFQTENNHATALIRDDAGNFVAITNIEGLGLGGKEISEPFRMVRKLSTGVKDSYGTELTYIFGNDAIAADGRGNLIIGSKGYACILIYNPEGIDGYTALKGKASRF